MDDGRDEDVRAAVERIGDALSEGWSNDGWWTGVDAGRLLFAVSEVDPVVSREGATLAALSDPRWFHTLDKAFQGRALVDDRQRHGNRLAVWATAHRFRADVVAGRLRRFETELNQAIGRGRQAADRGDAIAGTLALWRGIQLVQITSLERWGLRDNSLGRFGSRFAAAAEDHARTDLVARLDELADLDPDSVMRRAAAAPEWVLLRHDRSYRSRRTVGEPVASLADLRDTMRVCSTYQLREETDLPVPAWLAVIDDPAELHRRLATLEAIGDSLASGRSKSRARR